MNTSVADPNTNRSLPVTRELNLAYALTAMVGALLVTTSVAGLLFGAKGLYRPNLPTMAPLLAQDGITLAVGLPLLAAAAWTAHRASLRGLLLWLGMLFYFAYSYAYYLLSPEFNVLYLGYVVIVSASLYGLVYLLVSVDPEEVRARFASHAPARPVGAVLVVMALLMTMKWVSDILSDLFSGTAPSAVDLGVWPMDLAVAFPAMFWGGVWLWRRQALGYVVAGLLLVKAASVGLSLVVATWVTTLFGLAPDPMVPAYATIGLGALALGIWYFRAIEPPAARGMEGSRPLVAAA